MNRTALLVLVLLAAACGAPTMDGPAVDPGPDPDMGTDSAPAVPPAPPPPAVVHVDSGAHVDARAPDAPPRAEASAPVTHDAGGARDAGATVPDAAPPRPPCNLEPADCVIFWRDYDWVREQLTQPCTYYWRDSGIPNPDIACGGVFATGTVQPWSVSTYPIVCGPDGHWTLGGGNECSHGCPGGQVCPCPPGAPPGTC